jgi:hypothetical protein
VEQASAQLQPVPQEPKLSTNASPEPATSVRKDAVASLPPASGQNVAGIQFGMRDMTLEASNEAKQEVQEKRELAEVESATV